MNSKGMSSINKTLNGKPSRKVVRKRIIHTIYNKGFSYIFTLECGHTIRTKASNGVPKRKGCLECWMEERERKRQYYEDSL